MLLVSDLQHAGLLLRWLVQATVTATFFTEGDAGYRTRSLLTSFVSRVTEPLLLWTTSRGLIPWSTRPWQVCCLLKFRDNAAAGLRANFPLALKALCRLIRNRRLRRRRARFMISIQALQRMDATATFEGHDGGRLNESKFKVQAAQKAPTEPKPVLSLIHI